MEAFDETRLLLLVEGMPAWRRVAFMVYCCERMLPNYLSFSAETGFGNVGSLRSALDTVWDWVETSRALLNLKCLVSSCEEQAPDTTKFSSVFTSAALDATTAIAVTLEALTDVTAKQLIEVASLARDTIDLFVQHQLDLDPSESDYEAKITSSDLMQTELCLQRTSLEALKHMEGAREIAAKALRSQWSHLYQGSLDVRSS